MTYFTESGFIECVTEVGSRALPHVCPPTYHQHVLHTMRRVQPTHYLMVTSYTHYLQWRLTIPSQHTHTVYVTVLRIQVFIVLSLKEHRSGCDLGGASDYIKHCCFALYISKENQCQYYGTTIPCIYSREHSFGYIEFTQTSMVPKEWSKSVSGLSPG